MLYRRLVALPALAALAGFGMLAPPAARAQATGQGTIEGTVWRVTVRRNYLQDPGEPGLPGLSVELWNTTSIAGRPTRLQSVPTDSQGRYRFLVNPLSGPIPDFGCYEVRLDVLTGAGGSQAVVRSQPICQVKAGDRVGLDFPLPGGGTRNHAPSLLLVRVEPSGTQSGGTVRLQALGLDVDDDRLTYQWSRTAGTFTNPEGPLIDWTAPNQPGSYPVRVVASDPGGRSVATQVVIPVTAAPAKFNNPPLVEQVTATNLTPAPGQVVHLSVKASDPENDRLSNRFYILGGAQGAGYPRSEWMGPNEVLWQAPSRPGIYSTYAVVNDNRGGLGWGKRELSVNSAQTLNRIHPSYGRAGQVLIDSAGYLQWVGINDPGVAQQAAALAVSGGQPWVVGRIVPDPGQRHGFYVDPATVSLAEVTAEGIQTNVEQVSRRPEYFAPGGGGFAAWALAARLIQFVPAQ